jgi:hypothetical protein
MAEVHRCSVHGFHGRTIRHCDGASGRFPDLVLAPVLSAWGGVGAEPVQDDSG